MLIHEIAAEQTVMNASDLIEIEDGLTGASKKMQASVLIPILGLANQQLFMNAAGDGKEFGYGSKIVAYTRDMTAANGDVAYTGAGFKPRSMIVLAGFTASFCVSFGDIATACMMILLYGSNLASVSVQGDRLLYLIEDAANTKNQVGILLSMDADGCTIRWVKGGSPAAANGNFFIMYLR